MFDDTTELLPKVMKYEPTTDEDQNRVIDVGPGKRILMFTGRLKDSQQLQTNE